MNKNRRRPRARDRASKQYIIILYIMWVREWRKNNAIGSRNNIILQSAAAIKTCTFIESPFDVHSHIVVVQYFILLFLRRKQCEFTDLSRVVRKLEKIYYAAESTQQTSMRQTQSVTSAAAQQLCAYRIVSRRVFKTNVRPRPSDILLTAR